MAKINCAIYTRKSTEHGLDMEFNSLQNQEEACKAYILSQSFNGWEYYKTYSDGGISGGTMERPGLQALLNDIREGYIQVVVVYKVDRLSRSIIDFHKMMQEFDKYGCNFVSITQSFDTSNSMGKLTLNMLLSFAQFEREVSAERVRDKIAVSKAKGLWMGGTPPLGYDLKDKQLVPNAQEKTLVNLIFTKYLELGNIQATADWMNQQGYHSKCWQTASGVMRGGHLFRYGSIQRILGNPVYIGKMPHLAANKVYVGKQAALVSCETFEQAQSKIGNSKNGLREYRSYIRQKALLADKLFDDKGNPYKLTSTTKKGQKFQYYFIRNGIHIPVVQLDGFVLDTICRADLSGLDLQADSSYIGFNEAKTCLKRAVCIKTGTDCHLQIELDKNLFLDICRKNPTQEERQNDLLVPDIGEHTITLRATFYIDNVSSARLQNGTAQNILTVRQLNESLVRGLARAWQCKKMIEKGQSTREWEKASGMNKRTFARYLNLCYLSPRIVADILEYRNPQNMSLKELMSLASETVNFEKQEKIWRTE
ncbi:recombinase family protein [Candidatus Avelusimicrobium fimicolum]|jgi:site-specific DNA recombinase|uniref:recombinase family protein n=1 Tax=Candidatus Avelusimicrobium fimicolum TaxID=3416216 RepID=UPI003D0CD1D7